MKGRPLTNSEFWQQLVAKNTGRTDPLRHRNKRLLLLAGLSGLRESELTLITIDLFVSTYRGFARICDSNVNQHAFETQSNQYLWKRCHCE